MYVYVYVVVCSRSLWLRSASAVRSSRLPTLLCAVLFSSIQAVLQPTHYVLADGLAARWPSYQVRLDRAHPSGSLPSHCTGRLLVHGTNLLWGQLFLGQLPQHDLSNVRACCISNCNGPLNSQDPYELDQPTHMPNKNIARMQQSSHLFSSSAPASLASQ